MAQKNKNNSGVLDDDMDVDDAQEAGYDSDEEGGIRVNDEIFIPPPPRRRYEHESGMSRLMIDKIVNENFKSYADKVTVGNFSERFTAIIGPNGSGKSNVIDSMLFVFGYRSSKIRCKKTSSLIHNSATRQNIRKCRVSIHFRKVIDKTDGTVEAVPNSAIVISREACRDNTSFYELNGKKVQFKEIAKLLRGENVDLDHNRFLILQGEVEQIAMMKPKGQNENDTGMLEFLEDIIGTSRYKVPLEKLSQLLEKITDNRLAKLNRLRRVEAEKSDLEELMNDAVQYLKMENEIIKFQHQLYHCKRSGIAADIAERESSKEEIDADYKKLVEKISEIEKEKASKSKELKEKSKVWDAKEKLKDAATAEYDVIRKEDESLHAELAETNKLRKANIAKLKTEKASLEELAKVPEKNARDIEQCEALEATSTKNREQEQEALAKLMEKLTKKTAPLLSERQKHETKLISLRKDVDNAKGVFDLAESELNIYTSVEKTENEKLEELRRTLLTTSETLEERQRQVSSLKTKIPATAESLRNAMTEMESVRSREIEVSSRLKNMRVEFEEKRSAMNAGKSRNAIIDALMTEKREGRIPGIFGRLGDLGAIDAKYDVAISTACGPLDNVVVDTAETAEKCIKFLRERNVGRVTFIPLDKQQRFAEQCRQRQRYPENVPRLFDLIKVEDERVLVAFYFGLRDTLVATDLDQATRVAYGEQRYRVVTLRGELIEIAGTMSGGGKFMLRGRMGQSIVRNEPSSADIEKLQSNLDAIYEEYNRVRARLPQLEEQIRTLSTAHKDMTGNRDKFQLELDALTAQQPSLQAQLRAQERKAAGAVSNPETVKKLEKAVEEAGQRLKVVEELSGKTEEAVARLTREIEDISGGRVKEQQKKIGDLSKTIEKAKAEVVRLRVAIKTAERNTAKTEQRIENLENDVKSCERRLREIQGEKSGLEEKAKVILDKLKELTEILVERDEVTSAVREELNGLTARESKLKAVKIDLDQKIKESEQVLRDLRKTVEEYTRRIEGLKFRQVPGVATETLRNLTDEEVEALRSEDVAANLQRAKERLPGEIPNMQVIQDYQEKEAFYLNQVKEVAEITEERNKLRDTHNAAKERRCEEFLAGFATITDKLKEMYQMITKDGDAELELVDSMDPFNEGVVFSVRPPKKSWKDIRNLSGGEKTISSLALVFALHHYKPSPLYFMDEIDAALDFKNTSIIGNYIKQRAKNTQFIVVSLREEMFGLSNILVGIYKTCDATKTVTLNWDSFAKAHSCNTEARRPATQLPPKETGVDGAVLIERRQIAATCPGAIDYETPIPATPTVNLIQGLGDISALETPRETPRRRRGSSSDTSIASGTNRKSTRKRRRS